MSEPNWADKTIWTRDCLEVLGRMNSDTVDLIYLLSKLQIHKQRRRR